MISKNIFGHCLCRAIKYRVLAEPTWCGHCHCDDCRRNTGSCMATIIVFDRKAFAVTSGSLKEYSSSPGVTRSFCENCGTPITYESEYRIGEIHVNIGTLEHPENYPPKFHVNYKEKLSWLTVDDETIRYQALPESRV